MKMTLGWVFAVRQMAALLSCSCGCQLCLTEGLGVETVGTQDTLPEGTWELGFTCHCLPFTSLLCESSPSSMIK